MFKLLKEIDGHRDLLAILVARNLKIRYKRSALGFLWSLLNPLFFIIIYTVFLKILKFYQPGDRMFLPMLVTGVITWQFLATCVADSLHSITGNANLVQKTAFPRIILPLAMNVANLVNFLLSLVILMVYVIVAKEFMDVPIGYNYVGLLPLVFLTQFALCLGLSLIFGSLNVYFRDTEHIVSVLMLAWFFLTPVIYYHSFIPEQYQRVAFLNPMCGIVTAYRTAFLGSDIMAPRLVAMSFAIAWLVCAAGIVFFQKMQSRFVDEM